MIIQQNLVLFVLIWPFEPLKKIASHLIYANIFIQILLWIYNFFKKALDICLCGFKMVNVVYIVWGIENIKYEKVYS